MSKEKDLTQRWEDLVAALDMPSEVEIREVRFSCGDAWITVSASNERSTAAQPGEFDVYEYAGTILVRQIDYLTATDYAALLVQARGMMKRIEDMLGSLLPVQPQEDPF